jgi:protein-disulfide isomerase-like protein with CxxC motif
MTWSRSSLQVLLCVSLIVNVSLALKAFDLHTTVDALTARPALRVGDALPTLNLRTVGGQSVAVRYDTRVPTVLYIISPTCAWCARNTESIVKLAQGVGLRAQIVGLALTPFDKGQDKQIAQIAETMPFPVYTGLSDAQARELRLRSTPTTIVAGAKGKVVAVWEGAYMGDTKNRVEAYFGIALPNLAAAVPSQHGNEGGVQ